MTQTGWLNAPEPAGPSRRIGPALGASFVVHGVMAAVVLVLLNVAPPAGTVPPIARLLDVVYLPSDTPKPVALAGGGGGRQQVAAPRKIEIVASNAATVPTPTPTPVDPPPSLQVRIETSNATMLAGGGATLAAPPGPGGNGKNAGGLGDGDGKLAGPGRTTGLDGGFGTVGVDATNPVPTFSPQPEYTSEAMLAKVQGDVVLDVVVLASGRVGDVKVVRAPKPSFGLEERAIAAAKRWVFRPSQRTGVPVNVRVTIILTFSLR